MPPSSNVYRLMYYIDRSIFLAPVEQVPARPRERRREQANILISFNNKCRIITYMRSTASSCYPDPPPIERSRLRSLESPLPLKCRSRFMPARPMPCDSESGVPPPGRLAPWRPCSPFVPALEGGLEPRWRSAGMGQQACCIAYLPWAGKANNIKRDGPDHERAASIRPPWR